MSVFCVCVCVEEEEEELSPALCQTPTQRAEDRCGMLVNDTKTLQHFFFFPVHSAQSVQWTICACHSCCITKKWLVTTSVSIAEGTAGRIYVEDLL